MLACDAMSALPDMHRREMLPHRGGGAAADPGVPIREKDFQGAGSLGAALRRLWQRGEQSHSAVAVADSFLAGVSFFSAESVLAEVSVLVESSFAVEVDAASEVSFLEEAFSAVVVLA